VPPPAPQQQQQHDKYINLKGFAIGNPFTDPVENMVGMIDALNGHDVIPESLYERWLASEAKGAAVADVFYSHPCRLLQQEMWHEVGQGIDPYALDWPVCKDDVKMKGRNQRHALLNYLVLLRGEEEEGA
jgi:cathepsin A (carboxypeptidase C)/serine carboxypeptidase-like clade 2